MGVFVVFFVLIVLFMCFSMLRRERRPTQEFEEVDNVRTEVKFGEIKNGEFIEFQEKDEVGSWSELNDNEFDVMKEVNGRYAKPGSYDESYFINPKTGKFKLPRYRHQARFMVEINDETDYKDGFLADCYDKHERDRYGMMDFEYDAENTIYLNVDEFSTIFNKRHKKKLGEYSQFSGHYEYIERYFYIVIEPGLKENKKPTDQFLIDKGYLVEKKDSFDNEKAKRVMFRMLHKELTLVCDQYHIKHEKKADMIENLLNLGYVPEQFKVVTVSQKFTDDIGAMVDIYIDDIRANLERFHPMYIPFAWESVLDISREVPILEDKINEVISSNYWCDKLI